MRRLALIGLLALVLAGCSDGPGQSDEPTTGPSSSTTSAPSAPVSMIPADFPLESGMPPEESDEHETSVQSVGMRAMSLCGRKPLRGLRPVDRRAVEVSAEETASTRDLMLFEDTERPRAVLEDIREAADACPAEPTGPQARLLTEVRTSSLGSPGLVVLHTFEQGGDVSIGAEVVEVVQVGRALLVTSSYAEWDPATNLDEGIVEVEGLLEDTVAAMAVFS